jgi:hypothetical protein
MVQASDPQSVSILNEINRLLSARNIFFNYFALLHEHTASQTYHKEREELRALAYRIPPVYDLRNHGRAPGSDPETPTTYYYRTRYAVYSLPCTDQVSRPYILSVVAMLLSFMSTWQLRFRAALPEQHRAEHDRLYDSTVAAFEAWIAIARPLVSPALSTLRHREHSGRLRPDTPRVRLPHLLSLLLLSA